MSYRRIEKVFLILAASAISLMTACSGPSSLREHNLDNMIDNMERRSETVRQVKAEFTKTRLLNVFNKPMTAKGRLIIQKPSKFRLTLFGDVNLEVLSNGHKVYVIHDLKSQESHTIHGDRDIAQFADPLMMLVQGIGQGALRDYKITSKIRNESEIMLEAIPHRKPMLERVERAYIWLSSHGVVDRIRIIFRDGGIDDTTFHSWSILAKDDPEVLFLNKSLATFGQQHQSKAYNPPSEYICCLKQNRFLPGILYKSNRLSRSNTHEKTYQTAHRQPVEPHKQTQPVLGSESRR